MSAGIFWQDEVRCKCLESHSNLGLDISTEEYLHEGRPTTSMKKGWLYRTSCDEKNQEIAPFWDSTNDDDPDLMMIQMWWWSRIDDDPDLMMIQWWWSSSDDPVVMMIQIPWWRRLEEEDDLNMKKTWRRRWLEDELELKMKTTWRWRWWDDPFNTKKNTSVENVVERIPS